MKDFLAKQPIDIIINTEITDDKVVLPVTVDPDVFYKAHKGDIESDSFTAEKAVYVGSTHKPAPYQDANALLNSKVKY